MVIKLTLIKNTIVLLSVFTVCLLINTKVYAEARQGLLLNADMASQYDDNVFRKIRGLAGSSVQFSPELTYLTHTGKHLFSLDYQGEYTAYRDNSKLSYDDHGITLLARFDHSLKINSELKFSYKDKVERPGNNNSSSLLITEFNQTNKKHAFAKLYYGTKQSFGQLVLGLEYTEKRYTNNLQNYRDIDRNKVTGTFFYRIASKTRLLFQASLRDYDYLTISEHQDQSSKETFYLTGVEWNITAKTRGTFKLGYQGKDFKKDTYNDINALSYQLDMSWQPNTYSKIKIAASRKTQESSQLLTSAFIKSSYSLGAKHKVTERTTLKAAYTYDHDDIVSLRNRIDKSHNITFAIEHSLLPWLDISLDYRFIEKISDFKVYEYKANVIALSLTTNFK